MGKGQGEQIQKTIQKEPEVIHVNADEHQIEYQFEENMA